MTEKTSSADEMHRQINLLLPWYLNQSLDSHEQQQVEQHIAHCLRCRRELKRLQKLSDAVCDSSDLAVAADSSFTALQNKIRAGQSVNQGLVFASSSEKGKQPGKSALHAGYFNRWAKFALAASVLLALIPLGMAFRQAQSPPAEFYTLSAQSAHTSSFSELTQLRVVFAKKVSQSEIDTLLAAIKAQQVDGPNSMGAVTVTLAPDAVGGDVMNAVKFLREQRSVVLAEPVVKP